MTRRLALALAGIPCALALGAIVSHAIVPFLAISPRGFAQPVLVVTSWGGAGAIAWCTTTAALMLAGVAYAIVIAELRPVRADGRRLAAAIAGTASAAILACFAFRFIFSSDVYAYAAYGALAALGENPYHVHSMTVTMLQNTAFTDGVRFEWMSLPACVYGPAFVALLQGLVVAAHFDLARTILALRLVAIAAFLASIALIARGTPRGSLVAAVIGLNPVILWSMAEGHNDALTLLVVAFAAVVAQSRPLLGGVLAGASTLLKATGGLASLFLIYALGSRRFTIGALTGIVGAVVIQIATVAAAGGHHAQVASDFVGTPQAAIAIGLRGMLAAAALAIAIRHLRAGERPQTLAVGGLVIWMLLPHLYAWYGLWLLPLAAFTLQGSEGPALIAATFSGVLRYLPDAIGYPPAAPWLSLFAASLAFAVLVTPQLKVAWRTRPAEGTHLT